MIRKDNAQVNPPASKICPNPFRPDPGAQANILIHSTALSLPRISKILAGHEPIGAGLDRLKRTLRFAVASHPDEASVGSYWRRTLPDWHLQNLLVGWDRVAMSSR